MNKAPQQFAAALGLVGLLVTTSAGAATWSLDSGCAGNSSAVIAQGASCGGTPGLTVSGWTSGTGTTAAPTAGSTFSSAYLMDYGNLGIISTNENTGSTNTPTAATGPHAIDNKWGTEFVLLKFATAVNLAQVTIGWNGTESPTTTGGVSYNDSDITVMAYLGTAASGMSNHTSVGSLSSNTNYSSATTGWKFVGNYFDVENNTTPNDTANVSSTIYSTYWLVSAYNSAFSGTSSVDSNVDAFKLLSVVGNTCAQTLTGNSCGTPPPPGVPEPGSLALMGAALLGLMSVRRRAMGTKA